MIEEEFPLLSPFLRFSIRPLQPYTGASTTCSHLKSRFPLTHSEGLARIGNRCSSEPFHLAGSPTADPTKKHLPFLVPLSFLGMKDLTTSHAPNLRVTSVCSLAISLRRGRRPVGRFSPTFVSYLLKKCAPPGLFFHLGAQKNLRPFGTSSLRATPSRLAEGRTPFR